MVEKMSYSVSQCHKRQMCPVHQERQGHTQRFDEVRRYNKYGDQKAELQFTAFFNVFSHTINDRRLEWLPLRSVAWYFVLIIDVAAADCV